MRTTTIKRHVHGSGEDQVLVDEDISSGNRLWMLSDDLERENTSSMTMSKRIRSTITPAMNGIADNSRR